MSSNSNQIQVNTTNPLNGEVKPGFVLISANLRNTDKGEVKPEQRYRNIIIPELSLPEVSDKLRPVLLDKLYSLAQEQFSEQMIDSKRLLQSVHLINYTLDGILSFYATDARSGRMTKESVQTWFDSSLTKDFIQERKPTAVQGYKDNYSKLASPNHGHNSQTCKQLLSVMQQDDMTHPVAIAIASRMQATIEKGEKSVVEAL